MCFLIERSQLFLWNLNSKCLCFSRLQKSGFCKTCQSLILFFQFCLRKRNINLCHFFTSIFISCICNLNLCSDLTFFHIYATTLHLKHSIRKTKPKRKHHFFVKAVKISVTYINTFFVFFLFQIAIQIPILF